MAFRTPISALLRVPETMARTLPKVVELGDAPVRTLTALGQHVRNQRARSNMRIDDAAALCFVSASVLSRIENGKPVTSDNLMKVLEGLGVRMQLVSG
jgi:ribosome-binding protein aMBF1 (putative translation factor)